MIVRVIIFTIGLCAAVIGYHYYNFHNKTKSIFENTTAVNSLRNPLNSLRLSTNSSGNIFNTGYSQFRFPGHLKHEKINTEDNYARIYSSENISLLTLTLFKGITNTTIITDKSSPQELLEGTTAHTYSFWKNSFTTPYVSRLKLFFSLQNDYQSYVMRATPKAIMYQGSSLYEYKTKHTKGFITTPSVHSKNTYDIFMWSLDGTVAQVYLVETQMGFKDMIKTLTPFLNTYKFLENI